MSNPSAQRPVSRLVRILRFKTALGAVALIVLYTLAGFFLTPYLVKRQLTELLRDDLHRQLSIDRVRFNPYTLRMVIDGLNLKEGNGDPLLSFTRLLVDFDVSSVWERAWTFAEISLEKPELTLAIDPQGRANIARLVDDLPADPAPATPATDTPPPRLLAHRLHIGGGIVHLIDASEPGPAEATIVPLDLEVHDLTTIPQREGPLQLVARLPAGGSLDWRGEASLFPVHSHGRIVLKGMKPANAWRFFQEMLLIEEPGGLLDLETGYSIALAQGNVQLKLDGLTAELADLTVTPRGGSEPVLSLGTVTLDEGSLDLTARRLTFPRVTLARGKVLAEFDQKGALNWQALVAPAPASKREPPSPTEGQAAPGQPWRVDLGQVAVKDVAVQGTDLSRKVPINLSLGGLDLSLHLAGELAPDRLQIVADGIAATLKDTQFAEREDRRVLGSLAEIKLESGAIDLDDRRIAVKEVSIRGGNLAVRRGPDGQIDWVQQALDPGVVRDDAQDAKVRAESEGRPWSIAVSQVQVRDTSATFADQTIRESDVLGLSDITLKLTDVSMDPRQPIGFDLALKVEQGGAVSARGTVQPSEPSVDGTVSIEQLALATSQSYLGGLAHMKLESGYLSGSGEVHYGSGQPGSVEFTGDIDVASVKLVEPNTGKTLIGWDGVKTKGMRLGLAPDGLTLEEIVLSRPRGTFVIDENKATNWQYALKAQPGGAGDTPPADASASSDAPTSPATTVFPVSIARVRIEDGAMDFADLSLTPQFGTHIHELNGSIAGLSTAPGAQASIELEGRVDEYGSARIRGELQPSSPTTTTDIHMAFQNLEMTHLTPYSIKFAGHKVTSGKLSLDLGYKIDQHQLSGDNRVVVQHLELGEKVESPDALDLPLELGLALLKDPSGKIDINLPVQGDMSHPEFNFGQLISKAVVGFFGKLITAPFQILGGLLAADAQDLDRVAFEPGRSDLPPPEQEKLKMVAKALRERPQLSVSIHGTYDSHRDGPVLKEQKIRRAVAEARGNGVSTEEEPGPVGYNDPKSQQALEQVYSRRVSSADLARLKERFAGTGAPATTKEEKPAGQPSPGTAAGDTSGLYKAIYEELVKTAVVTHKELRALGTERAKSVQGELTGADGIAAERVTLAAPARAKRSSARGAGVVTRLDLAAYK